jgi:hypothetical protein
VLVNNAGVMDIPAQRTAGGFDLQTATNCLGPFVLTNLLLEHITDRVVSVTSQLHRRARLDLADVDWRGRRYNPMRLCRVEAGDRLVLPGTAAEAGGGGEPGPLGPGPSRDRHHHAGRPLACGRINSLKFLLNDPERGALPTLFAATQDVPGNAYVGPDGRDSVSGYPVIRKPGKVGLDATAARQLWEATARLTGIGD